MKKWALLFLVSTVMVSMLGCQEQSTTIKSENITKVEKQTSGQGATDKQESSMQEYISEDGFTLTFPESWDGDYLIEKQDLVTNVQFKSQDPNHSQLLFAIVKKEEEEWTKEKKEAENGPNVLHEITIKDGYAYLYFLPLDMILEGEELERYGEMAKDIETIIENLQLN